MDEIGLRSLLRLVLCDDHRLFLESLATVLSVEGHRVTTCTSPKDAIAAVVAAPPDVCVLDVNFPDGSGLDAARTILQHVDCPVLLLSASIDSALVATALESGVRGFIRKDQPIAGILRAIERVKGGSTVVDPRLLRGGAVAPRRDGPDARQLIRYLTPRERQVLKHLLDAADTTQIAAQLDIAPSTARTHVQNVLVKLGVHSRLQAVSLVAGAGLVGDL